MRIPLAVCALLVASCGADSADVGTTARSGASSITVDTTHTSGGSTASSSTAASTSTSTSTSTGTTAASGGRFDPPCLEYRNARPTHQLADEKSLDTFGPLASNPSLQITLPLGRSTAAAAPEAPGVNVKRIPGGVLLAVGASSSAFFNGSILSAVDADGARRWVRCYDDRIDGVYVAPASSGPTQALVDFAVAQAGTPSFADWRVLTLDKGSLVSELSDLLATQGIDPKTPLALFPKATSAAKVVLGPPDDFIVDLKRDRLLVLDLKTFTVETLPFPPMSAGAAVFTQQFEFADSGELVLVGRSAGLPAVLSAYHAGAWTQSATILRATFGTRVQFADSGVGLIGFDSMGVPIWRYDNVSAPGGEAFRTEKSGAVTVVSGCFGLPDPTGCRPTSLAGVATETGKILWQNRGWHLVSAVGDGVALITASSTTATDGSPIPGPWTLINTATGKIVDASQQWQDPDTFRTECCGGGEFVWVARDGGVVTAVNGEHIAIWYPSGAGLAPTTVSIP